MDEKPDRPRHGFPHGALRQDRRCELCKGSYKVDNVQMGIPVGGYISIHTRCPLCNHLNPLSLDMD